MLLISGISIQAKSTATEGVAHSRANIYPQITVGYTPSGNWVRSEERPHMGKSKMEKRSFLGVSLALHKLLDRLAWSGSDLNSSSLAFLFWAWYGVSTSTCNVMRGHLVIL